jgi:hypothetical protein
MFKQFRFSVSTEREEHSIMAATDEKTGKQPPRPRGADAPTAADGNCHTAKPPAAPASAAENHDAANQKCAVSPPKTASKDEREKAVG